MMRAFGAEVVLVDQDPGSTPGMVNAADMKLVRARAADLVQSLEAFYCDQHENPANGAAHEFGTAVELWKQCGEDLDAIVAFVGSGGALGGLARGLRRHRPELGVYVVEPAEAMALATCCCSSAAHIIQGGGYGKERLTQMDGVTVDGFISCTDEHATAAARMLAMEEGIMAGYSTGAQLHAAIELMRDRLAGKSVAFLVCDSGMKYLSTELYP